MKKRKWLYPVIGLVLMVTIGVTIYLTSRDTGIFIPDEETPAGGYFLNIETRLAIESIEAIEAASKKMLKSKDEEVINNCAMSIARIERYGYLKPGLEKILWNNYAGPIPDVYKTYFTNADPKTDPLLLLVDDLDAFVDPVTGDDIDLIHMIAVIDVFYTNYTEDENLERYYDYLMSWGGDLDTFAIDLNKYVQKNGLKTYDEIYAYAYKLLGSDTLNSYFSAEDYYADIDGVNIANMMMEEEMLLSEAIETYYKTGIVKNRHSLFVESFGGEEAFKNVVHSYVQLVVEEAYEADEEFVDFMDGFGSFKSMMFTLMGQDAGKISDNERESIEAVFVDRVLEGKEKEDLANELAKSKVTEKK